MKWQPLTRPLFSRGKAFHSDPRSLEPGPRRRIESHGELVLVELMEAAKAGHVEQLSAVIPLLHEHDDDVFWGRASLLLSYAAPGSVLRQLLSSFDDAIHVRKDDIVQGFIAETLLNSGLLWTVPAALNILLAQTNRTRMFSIPPRISSLLEDSPGDIFFGPDEVPEPGDWPEWLDRPFTYDDARYARKVMEVYSARLDDFGGDSGVALLHGIPIDIRRLAYSVLMTLGRIEDNDNIARIRMIIEAQTGEDLSAFFRDDLTLDRAGATQALERLFDTVDFDSFRPGRRYFFGRLLDQAAA